MDRWFVLTGHTLMAGDLGRTELASSAEDGARDLFRSVQRLKALPDYLEVTRTGISHRPVASFSLSDDSRI